MFTTALHHHHSTRLAERPQPIRIGGRSYPASQPAIVAASILARPGKPAGDFYRPLSFPRP